MFLRDVIVTLEQFWAERGCLIAEPWDVEMGAGTMAPETFFRALGPEPWRVAYVQPSRRPADARYGVNPSRLYRYYQFQVIIKPSPEDIQQVYLESLRALGIEPRQHDIRFVEDDWEAPTLGAGGLGWQVWLDGEEITQFTYFQYVGGLEVTPISVELTYGPERIAMHLQGVDHYTELLWDAKTKYGDLHFAQEVEQSRYSFECADVEMLFSLFDAYEREAQRVVAADLVLPAYELALKCSHTFNLLDARGALSVTQRTALINRVRGLAKACAEAYLRQREQAGYPLSKPPGERHYV